MPGDYQALKAELAKGDLSGLAASSAAAKLNSDVVTVLRPGSYLMEAGVVAVLGLAAGNAAMAGFEAAAQVDPKMARVVRYLKGDGAKEGVDFGRADTHAQLDALVAAGVIQAADAAALKAYGQETKSRAQAVAGWDLQVTTADVTKARAS